MSFNLLILPSYQCERPTSPSGSPRLGQPSPYARHDLVRLAVHMYVYHVPVGSVDHNVLGHAIQTTSTNDGGPEETPKPFGRFVSISDVCALRRREESYIARPSSQDLGFDNVPKR